MFRKVAWSVYELEHKEVKGTLRVTAIPIAIFGVPPDALPPDTPRPVFGWTTQAVVGFKNSGKKGPSEPNPVSQEEYRKGDKEDITSYLSTQDEPFNEYVIGGSPALLLRAKTVVTKVEWLVGRYNIFGDPALWVHHDTSQSTSELKHGDIMSR